MSGATSRKMEPTSIPALTRESQGKDADRKRYGTWQLERLDRQEPGKALDAALGDEALTIAILDVFRATHHREAVHAVWKRVAADSPRVRAAARAAWMDYVTGPPPPPAPTAKLNLPGGKLTKKPKPLWLTYRELADNELRKAANELLHEDYPIEDPTLDDEEEGTTASPRPSRSISKSDASGSSTTTTMSAPSRKRRSGPRPRPRPTPAISTTATQMVDRMLATNPDRSERAEMAQALPRLRQAARGRSRAGPMPPPRTRRPMASIPRGRRPAMRSPRTTSPSASRSRPRARMAAPTSAGRRAPARLRPGPQRGQGSRQRVLRPAGRSGCSTRPLAPRPLR